MALTYLLFKIFYVHNSEYIVLRLNVAICVYAAGICVCATSLDLQISHTHTHKCTLDTNLAYTQNCVSNIVASSSLLPTNSLARHADAAARREGGSGEMAAKFKVSMSQICSQSIYKQEAGD